MHDDSARVIGRLERYLNHFVRPGVHRKSHQLIVTAWEAPGEPVPFVRALEHEFVPIEVGSTWGKPWGTTWFHVTGEVPPEWSVGPQFAVELGADIGFKPASPGFQCEGTVYDQDGRIVKAVESYNRYVPLPVQPGAQVSLYIEAASNPDVMGKDWTTPSPLGSKETAGESDLYVFRGADLLLRDVQVWELLQDVTVLSELMEQLPTDTPRRADIVRALEDMLDVLDPEDVSGSAPAARERLRPSLERRAHDSAHIAYAVGHAHIDSAWLWPTRETIRKCARTFSNVLQLMDSDPDFIFACSSAQQFAWIKSEYPDLFDRIRERVREGRFVPVGGMWVESDTNMIGGEAMVRQFVEGKLFFLDNFDYEPREVWLPDSFGYSAALPQIARLAGSHWMLTQKLSWSDTNVMPHSTFTWEGIDGSSLFTHFPPVDSYNASLSGEELARTQRQYKENGRGTRSLVPFGYGDGGGGPTREMLAAAHRTRDLEGSPRVHLASPVDFFKDAEAEYPEPPTWLGELYLEYHRGVYTSQHRTKTGNRRSEHLLKAAELWATTAAVRETLPYPAAELRELWQLILLQQFHDILPGTSIAWVHREAEKNYETASQRLEEIIERSIQSLTGDGDLVMTANPGPSGADGVPFGAVQPRLALEALKPVITRELDEFVLDNGLIRTRLNSQGLITSIIHTSSGRELVREGDQANALVIHRDIPNNWEAWDIDEHYKRNGSLIDGLSEIVVSQQDRDRVGLRITRRWGASSFVQEIALPAGQPRLEFTTTVDWHERRKLLKLTFPLAIHAERATSEIQYGHVTRPIHTNTSWDAARFETVGHRWIHVGEPNFGIAIANDSNYGHDITRRSMDGKVTTLVGESLLRAPMAPDPEADQGNHVFHTTLTIGASIEDAVLEGYRLNDQVRDFSGLRPVQALFALEGVGAVIESVKLAHDESGDVIVRLYESLGDHTEVTLAANFPYDEVVATDLLERRQAEPSPFIDKSSLEIKLRPFEIVTLRFVLTR